MASLPLFPLGTVLVPGAVLPLQIFEPRYVALLRDLLDHQDERPPVFGVVAIREGFEVGDDGVRALHPVGTSARLTQAAVMGGRRFLVVAHGEQRFRLGALDPASTAPYAVAEVAWLDEPDGDADAVGRLAERLRDEVAAYRAAVGSAASDGEPVPPLEAPETPLETSYWLPEALSLDLADRQRLLECVDTESRLRLGVQLAQRERALAASLGAVQRRPDPPFSLN